MRVSAIVPAAGTGKRFKAGKPKAFASILGKPLLIHTLIRLSGAHAFDEIIVAAPPAGQDDVRRLMARFKIPRAKVVAGGKTRAESVLKALSAMKDDCEWVLVHDAARPLVSRTLVSKLLVEAKKTGAAIAAMPVTSTVKRADDDKMIRATEDRRRLYLAQTPQIFRKTLLAGRYRALGKKALAATDEAALFDGSRTRVRLVEGEARNLKITVPEDVDLFEFYLKRKG